MTSSFSSRSGAAEVLASITSVNLDARTARGISPAYGEIPIQFTQMAAGVYTVPAIGEQWIVERTGATWSLKALLAFQDGRINTEPVEGMTIVGRSGPTHIVGSRVDVVTEDFSVNGAAVGAMKAARVYLASGVGGRTFTKDVYAIVPFSSLTDTSAPLEARSGDPVGVWTITRAGTYSFRAGIFISNQAGTAYSGMSIDRNEFTISYNQAPGGIGIIETGDTIKCAVGDKIRVVLNPGTTGTLIENDRELNRLSVTYLG